MSHQPDLNTTQESESNSESIAGSEAAYDLNAQSNAGWTLRLINPVLGHENKHLPFTEHHNQCQEGLCCVSDDSA